MLTLPPVTSARRPFIENRPATRLVGRECVGRVGRFVHGPAPHRSMTPGAIATPSPGPGGSIRQPFSTTGVTSRTLSRSGLGLASISSQCAPGIAAVRWALAIQADGAAEHVETQLPPGRDGAPPDLEPLADPAGLGDVRLHRVGAQRDHLLELLQALRVLAERERNPDVARPRAVGLRVVDRERLLEKVEPGRLDGGQHVAQRLGRHGLVGVGHHRFVPGQPPRRRQGLPVGLGSEGQAHLVAAMSAAAGILDGRRDMGRSDAAGIDSDAVRCRAVIAEQLRQRPAEVTRMGIPDRDVDTRHRLMDRSRRAPLVGEETQPAMHEGVEPAEDHPGSRLPAAASARCGRSRCAPGSPRAGSWPRSRPDPRRPHPFRPERAGWGVRPGARRARRWDAPAAAAASPSQGA